MLSQMIKSVFTFMLLGLCATAHAKVGDYQSGSIAVHPIQYRFVAFELVVEDHPPSTFDRDRLYPNDFINDAVVAELNKLDSQGKTHRRMGGSGDYNETQLATNQYLVIAGRQLGKTKPTGWVATNSAGYYVQMGDPSFRINDGWARLTFESPSFPNMADIYLQIGNYHGKTQFVFNTQQQ